MTVRPSGTVTFLFTDIEGSTRRREADPDAARCGLALADAVDGWTAGFDGMVGYATKSGWMNDDGTKVGAHIEG